MFKKTFPAIFTLCIAPNLYALDLIGAFHLGLENAPEYKSAYLQQYSAAEFRSQSIAQMLPNLTFSASSTRERLRNDKFTFQSAGVQHYWNNQISINLTQPVFHWEHWIQLDQSDNQIAQSEAEHQASYQTLIVDITEAYFDILAAQDDLSFTVAEKQAIAKQLEQAQQRFDVGLIAITDVHEAQAAFDSAVAGEIESQNILDDSKERLRELIGNNVDVLSQLQKDIPLSTPEPHDIEAWTEAAENNNFSLIAQLNQTEFARKKINLEYSGYMPKVDLVANYGVTDNTSTFGLRGNTQNIGLQVSMQLFEGGGIYSRAQQAEYDYRIEKENLLKTKRSVIRNVRNAYRGVVASLSRVKALAAAVKSSQSALEASEAGFEVGTRTMVDVLDEQRDLYRAKRDYARTRYDYLINIIKLKDAAGSLVEDDLKIINQFLAS